MKKKKWLGVMLVAAVLAFTGCSEGEKEEAEKPKESDYPKRQVELVVPFAAGGGVDLAGRAVADYLSKEWGEAVVVANKPGGGGLIGAQYTLKEAKPDGYTVMVNNNSSTTMYEAGNAKPQMTSEDHKLVAKVAEGDLVYAVKADAEWDSFSELTDWVKENPEKLTWASVGPAGFSSFGVAEWLTAAGVDYKKTAMVTSEGASDSAAKVAGGHVILAVHTAGELAPLSEAGKIKVLAVQAEERNQWFPDVPTVKEQGFEDLTVKWWTGLSLPKETPEDIVKKWEVTIEKMQKDESFIEQLNKVKLSPAYLNAKDFTTSVVEETERYTKLAEDTGIRR